MIRFNFLLIDCPGPKLTEVRPSKFITVGGYNTTLKCSFDGFYSESSTLRAWVLFLSKKDPVCLKEQPYSDSKCWVKDELACSVGTDPNNCCRFEFTLHSTPRLADSGTVFSCSNGTFTNDNTATMCK